VPDGSSTQKVFLFCCFLKLNTRDQFVTDPDLNNGAGSWTAAVIV